jgi:hypothetical protein
MNSKIVIVLFLIAGAMYSVLSVSQNTPLVEGWWGGIQLSTRSEPNVQTKCGFQSIPDSNLGAGFMTVPGKYDTVPPARITGMAQTGASVKYNMPDMKNMAMNPSNPTQSVENYANVVEPFAQIAAARNDLTQNDSVQYDEMQMQLPSGGMDGVSGEQPQIYNRLIYANKKSRTYAQGDFFRGDVAIMPRAKSGWFDSSITPVEGSVVGYLGIDTGVGESARQMRDLKSAFMTGTQNSIATDIGPNTEGMVQVSTFPTGQAPK